MGLSFAFAASMFNASDEMVWSNVAMSWVSKSRMGSENSSEDWRD